MTGADPEFWDDVVDVICVGAGVGVLAYRNACAAADLDVLAVRAPAAFDPDTAGYLAAMTDDLTADPADEEPRPVRVTAAPLRRDARGRPDVLDTFVGGRLRQWSGRCLGSSSGVLFTAVPEVFTRMRTAAGEIITAAATEPAPGPARPADVFAGLIHQEGAPAGALLEGPSGLRRVRAEAGLAFALSAGDGWPPGANALVSRPYARFARLERLLFEDGGRP